MTDEVVLSLGIDIGTTTTSLVFSRLVLRNVTAGFVVPKIEIVKKEVIHRSPIHFTPLLDGEKIDGGAIQDLVDREFAAAKIAPGAVKSGAVIITGEAATKGNAKTVLSSLAEYAGDFVVATAGPDLEGILAGRGSGAARRSVEGRGLVANVDVGGGTTNIALFDRGQVVGTVAAHVGGRLLQLEPGTGRVTRVAPVLKPVLEELDLRVGSGEVLSRENLERITDTMAQVVAELLGGGELSPLGQKLLIGSPLDLKGNIREVVFSGGVAEAVYQRAGDLTEFLPGTRYGDIGLLLGESFRRAPQWRQYPLGDAVETIYATVIGAGMQLTELSGSTIHISDESVLPLRNVPVANPFPGELPHDGEEMAAGFRRALEWFQTRGGLEQPVALALRTEATPSFSRVKEIAGALQKALTHYLERELPVVLVLESDIGKVLGFSLRNLLPKGTPVISVDQIQVSNGDYIDIGYPLYQGAVVPVAVKTLVFPE